MKKLMAAVIYFMLSVLLLVSAAYAWFTNRAALNNFVIVTGNIDLEVVDFCKFSDFDFDGITDVDESGGDVYIEIDYSEPFLLSNLSPADIVTFKLSVKNIGNISGLLNIYFNEFDGGLTDVMVLYSAGSDIIGDVMLSGEDKITVFENLPLEVDETFDAVFALKFADLQQIMQLNPQKFSLETADLNEYQSAEFTMKIIAELKSD
ncbi:MAG: hypothetical protein PHE12_03105 [Clostridia bacterium]|nr:hypothetical protein [Clostridia bacterium]